MAPLEPSRSSKRGKRAVPPSITREDSDDELGTDDHPWEWVYAERSGSSQHKEDVLARKRKRPTEDGPRIIGARMGSFACRLGDIVLLKGEGSGDAWVGIICDFQEDEDGEKAANFMWFSSQSEIRNKEKKQTDFLPVSRTQLVTSPVGRNNTVRW